VRFGDFNGRHVAVWGLAFRPNTEDLREAPSRTLLSDLFATGATATAHARVAMEAARRVCADEACLIYLSHPWKALEALGERAGLWKVFNILSPFYQMNATS